MPAPSLSDVLRGRIRARTLKTQTSYQIDLRGLATGDLGQPTMRLPGVSGWPKRGPTITTEEVALSDFVIDAYAEHVQPKAKPAKAAAGSRVATIDEACETLLSGLEESFPNGRKTAPT
jgi:hypothetical protein